MSENLKTLKDLATEEEIGNPREHIIRESELKQEAIKWVKHWRSIDQHCVTCDIWNEKRQDDMMHFFNITQEDLEEEDLK